MVRLAALDVGTNSTRLLVADVEDGVIVAEHAREMVITRLGKGVDHTGRFEPAALARTLDVLAGYAETCRRLGVERRRLVATSATRDAADRQVFRDSVRDLLGVEAEILTGQAEAAAAYRGATHGLDGEQATLVVDIGGGSTELILGDGTAAKAMVSLDIGCVRLFERHLHSDPPAASELEALAADARGVIEEQVPAEVRSRAAGAVAVAGTATSCASIDLELDPYDPERVEGHRLSRGRIAELRDRLAALPLAQRRAVTGLDPNRAPTIVAGTVVLLQVLGAFELDAIEVSERDILWGVALDSRKPL
jgi:exopolyphosphatase/guanosine-5'-triphosphate,3'-diphosphate pyrophosphatase